MFKKSSRDTSRMNVKLLVRPDLGPNCLQRLSTDDKNRPEQDTFIASGAHARNVQRRFVLNAHEMCMVFCHQVSMHNPTQPLKSM